MYDVIMTAGNTSRLQMTWQAVYDMFDNEFYMDVIGSNIIAITVFWVVAGLFALVDLTGRPTFMKRYKTQPDKNTPVDPARVRAVVKVALINQLCVGLPVSIVLYHARSRLGASCLTDTLPSTLTVLRDLFAFLVIEEIGFYYTHRLLHWGPLYRAVHKQHHEWTAPIGLVAQYAHPFEHLLSNVLPFVAGPLLVRSHLSTTWLWYVLAMITTVAHHSGYHLPFMPSSEFHDFHHLKFSCNYGVTGTLDWLHGTDKPFRQSVQYNRHRVFTCLTPANLIYPDKKMN